LRKRNYGTLPDAKNKLEREIIGTSLIDTQKLWLIDDVTDATCLLPADYSKA
jgi:hypothetical protein